MTKNKVKYIMFCFIMLSSLMVSACTENSQKISTKVANIILRKSDINVDILKIHTIGKINKKVIKQYNFDKNAFDISLLNLYSNNQLITNELIKTIPIGKYFAINFELIKDSQVIDQGKINFYFLSKEELEINEQLMTLDEVVIDKDYRLIENFEQLMVELKRKYQVLNSAGIVTENTYYIMDGIWINHNWNELRPWIFSYFYKDDFSFSQRIFNWSYKNDCLRNLKKIANQVTSEKIGTINIDLTGKTIRQANEEFLKKTVTSIKKIIGPNYQVKVNDPLLNTFIDQLWFPNNNGGWYPPIHWKQIIKKLTFIDNSDNKKEFATSIFLYTKISGAAISY